MTTQSISPKAGDIIRIDFSPQKGHEQAGFRPALVVSPGQYNAKAGLALVCPITLKRKGYPFEVALPPGLLVTGVVLCDQIRSIDYSARDFQPLCSLPEEVLDEVRAKIAPLIA